MKTTNLFIFLLIGLTITAFAQSNDYAVKARAFQDSLNSFEANPATTQIFAEEFSEFVGLHFFPIDQKYRFCAQFVAVNDTHVF